MKDWGCSSSGHTSGPLASGGPECHKKRSVMNIRIKDYKYYVINFKHFLKLGLVA
jgi:hypothetical protein